MVKIRIRGIDHSLRELSRAGDTTYDAARRGTLKAATYLLGKILAKFGHYQSTGGPGNGPWPKLKYDTILRKVRRHGAGNKPLIDTGKMSNRYNWQLVRGGPGTIAASVGTNDERLLHHIYGAPRAGVPQRDPCRVTAVEEAAHCRQIIADEITEALIKEL